MIYSFSHPNDLNYDAYPRLFGDDPDRAFQGTQLLNINPGLRKTWLGLPLN